MIVQVYEVVSAAEAEALAARGVDHVGVLVGPGRFPRELPLERAAEVLAARLPPSVARVALSLAPDPDEVAALVRALAPDVLHVGTLPERLGPDELRRLRAELPGPRWMRSVPVTGPESLEVARSFEGVADLLLLDSHRAGDAQVGATGATHDWALSRRIVEAVRTPVVLAGGLGPDNVAAAIRAVRPWGVDSKTRTDRADGAGKDLDRVERFVAAARAAASLR